jgi:hypothetical protein
MKWQSFRVLFLCIFVLVTGCSAPKYFSFDNPPARMPTGSGTDVEYNYSVPVYTSLPEKGYDAVGMLRFNNPNTYWNTGDIRVAAKRAKQNGADAMILAKGSSKGVSLLGHAIAEEARLGKRQSFGIAIKWNPNAGSYPATGGSGSDLSN